MFKYVEYNIICIINSSRKHATEYPNMVQLLHVMVASPANTSFLERSHTLLQMIAAAWRNHFTADNLELLYLLATLKQFMRNRKPVQYAEEAALLSS